MVETILKDADAVQRKGRFVNDGVFRFQHKIERVPPCSTVSVCIVFSLVWFGSFIGELSCARCVWNGDAFGGENTSSNFSLSYQNSFHAPQIWMEISFLPLCTPGSRLYHSPTSQTKHRIKCKHSENIVIAFCSWIQSHMPFYHEYSTQSQIPNWTDKHRCYTIDDMRFLTRDSLHILGTGFGFQFCRYLICIINTLRILMVWMYVCVSFSLFSKSVWLKTKNNIYSMNKSMWINRYLKCAEWLSDRRLNSNCSKYKNMLH